MNNVKCPKCGKALLNVTVESVDISAGIAGKKWVGAIYSCPWGDCHAFLGVQIDPIALVGDIAGATSDAMTARLSGVEQKLDRVLSLLSRQGR